TSTSPGFPARGDKCKNLTKSRWDTFDICLAWALARTADSLR
ncbi:MAG: hypothetical protein ACJAUZ_001749, partial [Flavobacteriaceae bacterium]